MVVVILGMLIGWATKIDDHGVKILGEINSSFPTPIFPPSTLSSFSEFTDSLQPAVIIGILGFIGRGLLNAF